MSNWKSMLQTGTGQVVSLSKEVAKFASAGFPVVSDAVFEERMAICGSCESFNLQEKRCLKCGCYMEAKAKMATTKCPLGKWQEAN